MIDIPYCIIMSQIIGDSMIAVHLIPSLFELIPQVISGERFADVFIVKEVLPFREKSLCGFIVMNEYGIQSRV